MESGTIKTYSHGVSFLLPGFCSPPQLSNSGENREKGAGCSFYPSFLGPDPILPLVQVLHPPFCLHKSIHGFCAVFACSCVSLCINPLNHQQNQKIEDSLYKNSAKHDILAFFAWYNNNNNTKNTIIILLLSGNDIILSFLVSKTGGGD